MDSSQEVLNNPENHNLQNVNSFIQVIPYDYSIRGNQNQNEFEYGECRSQNDFYSIQNFQSDTGSQQLYSVSQMLTAASSYSPVHHSGDWENNGDGQNSLQCDGKESCSSDSLEKSVMGSNMSNCSNQTATSSIAMGSLSGGSTASVASPPLPPASSASGGSASTATLPKINNKPISIIIYLFSRLCISLEISNDEDPFEVTSGRLMSAVLDELQISSKSLATEMFALWMTSPLLELQLESHQCPYKMNSRWQRLLQKYSSASRRKREKDEPILRLQRNAFYSKQLEEDVKDARIIELLYEEARHNVIKGKYPLETAQAILLGGLQARITLGPYDPHRHTDKYFRDNQELYLPSYARSNWWVKTLMAGRKSSVEAKLLEHMQRAPPSAAPRKLRLKYLAFCRAQPAYGAAFFQGQIEQPVRSLTSLLFQTDIPVLVAINASGIFVIDDSQSTMLLSLLYEELSWEVGLPPEQSDEDCYSCLFLQFMVVENGLRVSKILQVFSKQATLMDTLIEHFAKEFRKSLLESENTQHYDYPPESIPLSLPPLWRPGSPERRLATKLAHLALVTHDAHGTLLGGPAAWYTTSTPTWRLACH